MVAAPHRRRAAQPAPRRPRLPQALRRLQGGHREPRHRRPDGHPLQDDQGLDARRGLRGPQRHAPDQEDDQGPARRPARPAVPARRDPRRRARGRRPAVLPPGRGLGRVPVHDGAPPRRSAARCPSARPRPAGRCELPTDKPFAELRGGSGNQAVSTTMGFTRLLRNLARDEQIGPRDRADHPRRGPHVRHGRAVPRAQDLRRPRPEVRAGRPRPAAQLHRVDRRPDPRGGHHRGRLDGQLHRRRHQLRPPRRADGALLHVLFDVRLPARRRPHLAGRRRPRPRLPARRHRRAHDAARRGPPAPGRPQPRAGLHGAGRAGLRPGVRLRGGGHRPGRPAAHVRPGLARGRARRLLLPHPLQRELRDAADAGGRRRRDHQPASSRACTSGRRAPEDPTHRATILFSGSAQGAAREAVTELAEHYDVGAELWSATSTSGSARTPSPTSAGTGCTPSSRRARRGSPSCSPTRRARSSPSPTS